MENVILEYSIIDDDGEVIEMYLEWIPRVMLNDRLEWVAECATLGEVYVNGISFEG